MAVVLQLVAVLRPAGGHRERRLGEQPGIAAPAEIQWASGVAGAEVVTNMEPKLPLPLVGAGASSVASGNTSAPRRPPSHCRRPSRRSGRPPGGREGAIRRITAQQTEIVAVPPGVMIKIGAAEAAKNLDTHRAPPDGQPVRHRREAHAPCARWARKRGLHQCNTQTRRK